MIIMMVLAIIITITKIDILSHELFAKLDK